MTEEQVPTIRPNDILTPEESKIVLPRVTASIGNDSLDVSRPFAEGKTITPDPGYANTASCEPTITFIDSDKGILRYQGYPIEQLVKNSSFLEATYFLTYGELPGATTLGSFTRSIQRCRLLYEDFKVFFTAFPRRGHPIAILQADIASLATYYENTLDPRDSKQPDTALVLLLAKIPTVTSYIARWVAGLPLLYPNSAHGYAEDFIHATLDMSYRAYDTDPALVRTLNMLLVLHADHERDCLTSTVCLIGSSQANLYVLVTVGVDTFAGPLHSGTNEAILWMFHQVHDIGEPAQSLVDKVRSRAGDVYLMGFGHHAYKNYDPQVALTKETAHEVLSRLDKRGGLPDITMELEDVALDDDHFRVHRLYPNMSLYTGLVYSAMRFPMRIFTPLFALGHLPGWVFQYVEMTTDSTTEVRRPHQMYAGRVGHDYVSLCIRAPRLSV